MNLFNSPASRPQWYDRLTGFKALTGNRTHAGGDGGHTLWTYTVPAGTVAMVQSITYTLQTLTAPTAAGAKFGSVFVSIPGETANVHLFSNLQQFQAAAITVVENAYPAAILPEGTVIDGSILNQDTGGLYFAQLDAILALYAA